MPRGKQYGEAKPHAASTDIFGASSLLHQGHPARLIMDRIYAIGQEIRGIAAEAMYYGKHPDKDTDEIPEQKNLWEGDSTDPGNDQRTP